MVDKKEDIVIWSDDMKFWDRARKQAETQIKQFAEALKLNEGILELCNDKFDEASKVWDMITDEDKAKIEETKK